MQKQIEKRRADLKLERAAESLALEEARARLRKAALKLETPSSVMKGAELHEARADHEIARQEIIHLETRLESIDSAAAEELQLLARQFERAERNTRELQFATEAMTVKAPRDGIVVMVQSWDGNKKKVGDGAWRGEPIVEIPNLEKMRTAYPGDTFTVNVGALSHRAEAPFSTRHAASLRAIHDLGTAQNSIWIHSTGQVGNPFSDLYASMLPLWRDVQYLPMQPASGRAASILELRPR